MMSGNSDVQRLLGKGRPTGVIGANAAAIAAAGGSGAIHRPVVRVRSR